jgi:Leucine rich repeat N-terminal domain
MTSPSIRSLTIAVSLFASMVGARPSDAAIPPSERAALIAFYNSTGGPHWTKSTRWLGVAGTECSWFGVECSGAGSTERVISLDLGFNNLAGTIPPQIDSLTKLAFLELVSNALSGPIPAELGKLTNLTALDLGVIPAEYGKLNSNGLTGPIPVELGNLSKLTFLRLSVRQ